MTSSTTEFFYFAANSDFECSDTTISPKKYGHLSKLFNEHNVAFILSCGNITQHGYSNELSIFIKNIFEPLQRDGKEMFLTVGEKDIDSINYYASFLGYTMSRNLWKKIHQYLPKEKNVHNWIKKKYNDEKYTFVRGGIRFVSLAIYPSMEVSDWLQSCIPNDLPLIVFFSKGH